MLTMERDISFFHLRGVINFGLFRVLFGHHRGPEGWYFKIKPPLWWRGFR